MLWVGALDLGFQIQARVALLKAVLFGLQTLLVFARVQNEAGHFRLDRTLELGGLHVGKLFEGLAPVVFLQEPLGGLEAPQFALLVHQQAQAQGLQAVATLAVAQKTLDRRIADPVAIDDQGIAKDRAILALESGSCSVDDLFNLRSSRGKNRVLGAGGGRQGDGKQETEPSGLLGVSV